ncbi:MAG: hypothetical protein AAF430_13700 [Myxococcota bacterium]
MRRGRWIGIALVLASGSGAEEAPTLHIDPFRPLAAESGTSGGSYGRAPAPGWQPVLQATLVGADGGFANLGGEILRVGEATRGYRLVEVGEWDAVFEHGGSLIRLSVSPPARSR